MKLHGLTFHEKGTGDEAHIHTTGRLEINHKHPKTKEESTILIPVNYKLHASEDPARHEEILSAIEAKARIFAERRHEFRGWAGAKETIGDIDIEITDCQLQHFGANDWKLYVAWFETHGGVTQKLRKTWTHTTPAQAMPLESLQALVRGEVAARSTTKVNLSAHKERLNAIHLAHSEEARGLRASNGQGDPGANGSPVGAGGE